MVTIAVLQKKRRRGRASGPTQERSACTEDKGGAQGKPDDFDQVLAEREDASASRFMYNLMPEALPGG